MNLNRTLNCSRFPVPASGLVFMVRFGVSAFNVRGVRSVEPRTQNPERRTRNAEPGTQNQEREGRTPQFEVEPNLEHERGSENVEG